MQNDPFLALQELVTLKALHEKVTRVSVVVVLVPELLAECQDTLKQLVAVGGTPRCHIELIFDLILVKDLGNAVVVDGGPNEYTAKIVLALAVLYDGNSLRLVSATPVPLARPFCNNQRTLTLTTQISMPKTSEMIPSSIAPPQVSGRSNLAQ
jgi:hypothetical protein